MVVFLSRSESGALCVRRVHCSSNKYCATLCDGLRADFVAVFTVFFQKTSAFQMHYMILISVATRWRHKISKFAVEIFQNVKLGRRVCTKYFAWLLTFTVSHGSAYTVVSVTPLVNGKWQFWGCQNSVTPEPID